MLGPYVAIAFGVVGAVLVAQFPGFTVQYMQNLNGRIDELEPIVEEFRQDVAVFNYTIESALLECETADGLLDALCDTFEDILLRYEELKEHYELLDSRSGLVRPFQLMQTVHVDIAESVMEEFEPVVPTSEHGLMFAGFGFLVFWGVSQMFFCGCHRLCRSRKKEKNGKEVGEELPIAVAVPISNHELY